jgi:uncharacterized protein Veg
LRYMVEKIKILEKFYPSLFLWKFDKMLVDIIK